MTLIDCWVTKVLAEPEQIKHGNLWRVLVEYDDDAGVTGQTMLYFRTKEEALDIKIGYEFLH